MVIDVSNFSIEGILRLGLTVIYQQYTLLKVGRAGMKSGEKSMGTLPILIRQHLQSRRVPGIMATIYTKCKALPCSDDRGRTRKPYQYSAFGEGNI